MIQLYAFSLTIQDSNIRLFVTQNTLVVFLQAYEYGQLRLGHSSASTMLIPFLCHKILIIFPISNRYFPYISFLLYFGANTM